MTLQSACMECQESLRGDDRQALAAKIIEHYRHHDPDTHQDLYQLRARDGHTAVLQRRDIATRPLVK